MPPFISAGIFYSWKEGVVLFPKPLYLLPVLPEPHRYVLLFREPFN